MVEMVLLQDSCSDSDEDRFFDLSDGEETDKEEYVEVEREPVVDEQVGPICTASGVSKAVVSLLDDQHMTLYRRMY